MSLDRNLHFYIQQQIPKEFKEEILNYIHKHPYIGRGLAAKNAKIIFEWLKKHNYNPPLNKEYSVDHIKNFIDY